MKLSASFAVLATVIASAVTLAAPTSPSSITIPLSRRDGGAMTKAGSTEVDFAKVSAHLQHLKAKYADTLTTFTANTGKVNAFQAAGYNPSSVQRRATGTESLTDIGGNSLWSGPVTLGGQKVYLDFDSGSSDIIINHNAYTPGSTAKNTGKTFTVQYGDGTTGTGPVYEDKMVIAGLTGNPIGFGWANGQFLTGESPNQGIGGVAFQSIAQTKETVFTDALKKQGAISKNILTFTLNSNSPTMYIGGVDPAAGTPTYTSVDSGQGYWGVDSSSINGKSTSGIVDTGTTLIVAPTSYAKSLFASMGLNTFTQDGTLYAEYNCNSPPTVTVKIGSYSQKLASATDNIGTDSNGNCVLGVVGEDVGLNGVIYGDVFLQNVHAVFDKDNSRIGFSKQ